MTLSSERQTVQKPFVRYAEEVGWTYLSPEEALGLRGGEDSPVLRQELVKQVQRLNPGVVDSVAKAEEVVRRLLGVRPNIEGNLEAWEYLKGLKTVFVEAERREKNLRLLDFQNLEANTFHVTDEFAFSNGHFRIRADVVLLVNGIPVIVVETKAATRLEASPRLSTRSAATTSKVRTDGAGAALRPHPSHALLLRPHLEPLAQGAL